MKLKVLGHMFDVDIVTGVFIREGTPAIVKHFEEKIEVDKDSAKDYVEEALLHEIFEAITRQFDLGNKEFGHQSLSSLSEGLYAVIKDNPDFFKFCIPGTNNET